MNLIRDRLCGTTEMDQVERIIRDATAKSKDGRITAADFLNEAAHSLRYGIFTPVEANIIWHFASRGSGDSSMRLANVDFDALLDPKVGSRACHPAVSVYHQTLIMLYRCYFISGPRLNNESRSILRPLWRAKDSWTTFSTRSITLVLEVLLEVSELSPYTRSTW